MLNILHSIGWGLLAMIGAQLFMLIVIADPTEPQKERDAFYRGSTFVSFVVGLAVFLLTL